MKRQKLNFHLKDLLLCILIMIVQSLWSNFKSGENQTTWELRFLLAPSTGYKHKVEIRPALTQLRERECGVSETNKCR